MPVSRPAGTYFVVADAAALGASDGLAFCRELPSLCGVVGVPVSVFHDDEEAARTLVRFAFCKKDEVLAEAAARLATLNGREVAPLAAGGVGLARAGPAVTLLRPPGVAGSSPVHRERTRSRRGPGTAPTLSG